MHRVRYTHAGSTTRQVARDTHVIATVVTATVAMATAVMAIIVIATETCNWFQCTVFSDNEEKRLVLSVYQHKQHFLTL